MGLCKLAKVCPLCVCVVSTILPIGYKLHRLLALAANPGMWQGAQSASVLHEPVTGSRAEPRSRAEP